MAGISASRAFSGNQNADGECFPGFRAGSEQLNDLCGVVRHDCTAGQRGIVTATGTLCVAIVAAARVQALMELATAATIRNFRRIGSASISMGVFVGGVLSTLSAWVILGTQSFWLGLEPGRKVTLPLGLLL
jgi:hypothetical protein